MERYIFCAIAVLIQPLFIYFVYFKKQRKTDAVLKVPLIFVSGVYVVIQLYIFFKYCIKLRGSFEIYSYIIQTAILLVFIVVEVLLLLHNSYIKEIDKKESESIADYKYLIEQMSIKKIDFDNLNIQREIDKVLNEMRYQDPVSSVEVREINKEIEILIEGITEELNEDEISSICNKISKLLKIRNIKNTKEKY